MKKNIKDKNSLFGMRLLLIIIVLMIAAAVFIIHEQQTDFKTMKGIYEFGRTYFKWVGMVVGNAKDIAGSASKMSWIPQTK